MTEIPTEILGEWQALLEIRGQEYRIILELIETPAGELAGFVENLEAVTAERMPLEGARFHYGELRSRVPGWEASLRCSFTRDGGSLEGSGDHRDRHPHLALPT